MKTRMLLIDVKNCDVREVHADGLEDYYELLDCECVDIVTRRIGNKLYDIICDDEGLLVENPIISAVDKDFQPMLVGNLLIAGLADEEGHLTSLTDRDILRIEFNILVGKRSDRPDGYPILTKCNYI